MNTEALNRYHTAKGYLESAKYIYTSPHRTPERVTLTVLPMHMLVGFSLELFFKAWLLEAGTPSHELTGKKVGHNLQELYKRAKEKGLPGVLRLTEVVDLFAEPHGDFIYRYIDEGDTVQMANWELAFPVLDQLDFAVDRFIGASASHGLAPGRYGA